MTDNTAEPFIYFAHRGASGHAPENTLAAVQKALDLGASWIEVDVYLVEDRLVVIHDRRLDRTTNGTGEVTATPLSVLRALDAGGGEKIPFLSEVIDAVAGRAGINIELKGQDTAGPVADLISGLIAQNKLSYDQVIVSSFHHDLLREITARDADIRIGVLLKKVPKTLALSAHGMGAYAVHVSKKAVNKKLVADAHARGMKVFVYTIDCVEDLRRVKRMGGDGVFTNYPELGRTENSGEQDRGQRRAEGESRGGMDLGDKGWGKQ